MARVTLRMASWVVRTGVLGIGLALAVLVGLAHAADSPQIQTPPAVGGLAQVGGTLTASGGRYTPSDAKVTLRWVRCDPGGRSCARIQRARGTNYVVQTGDLGKQLGVELVVRRSGETTRALSSLTAVVAPGTPAPGNPGGDNGNEGPGNGDDDDAPIPAPAPSPSPSPGPSTSPTPTTPAPSVAPAGQPALLSPFPVVRIRGSLTRRGARISLLSVRAPRAARILATCKGAGCPAERVTASGTARLKRYERHLRAGVEIRVRVFQAARVGKYTSFLIRRGRSPLRRDRCLAPGAMLPSKCPAG